MDPHSLLLVYKSLFRECVPVAFYLAGVLRWPQSSVVELVLQKVVYCKLTLRPNTALFTHKDSSFVRPSNSRSGTVSRSLLNRLLRKQGINNDHKNYCHQPCCVVNVDRHTPSPDRVKGILLLVDGSKTRRILYSHFDVLRARPLFHRVTKGNTTSSKPSSRPAFSSD